MYRHVGGGGLLDGRGQYDAYLDIEERNGDAYQWVESQRIGVRSELVRRMLVLHGAPWKPAIAEMIAEMTPYWRRESLPPPRPWAAPEKIRTVGYEIVTIAAGTFAADVIEYERHGIVYRNYISRTEPRGLILRETPGYRYELTAWGSDAQTKIAQSEEREERPGLGSFVTASGVEEANRGTSEEEAARIWSRCVSDHAIGLGWYDGAGMEGVWDVATERCVRWEPDAPSWSATREELVYEAQATVQEVWSKSSSVELTEDTCQERPNWFLLQRCQEILNGE